MRVLLVAPCNSIHTKRWVERLANLGVEIFVYNSSSESQSILGAETINFEPILIQTNEPNYRRLLLGHLRELLLERDRIKYVVEKVKPDILHVHWLLNKAALAASLVPFKERIVSPWGSDVLRTKNTNDWTWIQKLIWRISIRTIIKRSVAISADGQNLIDAVSHFIGRKQISRVIRFGVDTKLFAPANRRADFFTELGAEDASTIVISNRSLYPIYNVECFISAALIVLQTSDQHFFVIAGDGPDRPNLERIVQDSGFQSKFAFVGQLTEFKMAVALASSDLYVSTSSSDGGIAQSVVEALASATPILVTDFGENSEWTDGGTVGKTFRGGNPLELAAKIMEVFGDLEWMLAARENCRAIVLAENDALEQTKKMIDLYTEIVQNAESSMYERK